MGSITVIRNKLDARSICVGPYDLVLSDDAVL